MTIVSKSSPPIPTPRGWFTVARSNEITKLYRETIAAPYRNDFLDDWAPDVARDCQGKVAYMISQLIALGWPSASLRGYVVEFHPWYNRLGLPAWLRARPRKHAILVVGIHFGGKDRMLYFDTRRRLPTEHLPEEYSNAKPAVGGSAP